MGASRNPHRKYIGAHIQGIHPPSRQLDKQTEPVNYRRFPRGSMSQIIKPNVSKAYAAVAGLTIFAITGLEGYALSQGINGNALTASLAAIAGLDGAGIGRLFK